MSARHNGWNQSINLFTLGFKLTLKNNKLNDNNQNYGLTPLSVSQLNRQIRIWLENDIGEVSVIGELSNLSRPSSGHYYFTLKDSFAQLRCVYFRSHHCAQTLTTLADGQQVIVWGQLSVYEARGDYQLIVHLLQATGLGELYQKFIALKNKLQEQGLFEPGRKRILPRFPKKIGVITSPTGAALQDILTTLARRYPVAVIKIYASEVQGTEAHLQLIQALLQAEYDKNDVLILARGGGSIEDLWAFNNETLALTISQLTTPLVSGVGHETDFTIVDFVADFRAATPTAAAEAVTPNKVDLLAMLQDFTTRITCAINSNLRHNQLVLKHYHFKITSCQLLINNWQKLDFLDFNLTGNLQNIINFKKNILHIITIKLQSKNPSQKLAALQSKLQKLQQQLMQNMYSNLFKIKQILACKISTLHAVSPLATLNRGYAIASKNNKILLTSKEIQIGDKIDVHLASGKLQCEVRHILK